MDREVRTPYTRSTQCDSSDSTNPPNSDNPEVPPTINRLRSLTERQSTSIEFRYVFDFCFCMLGYVYIRNENPSLVKRGSVKSVESREG